jgi:hypothetical protein
MKEEHLDLVSEELRQKAHVMSNGEALWPKACVTDVLREVAGADRVILGFDIVAVTLRDGFRPSIYGTSAYDLGLDLNRRPWEENVGASLQLALRDVERSEQLSGLTPPHDDVWYTIVSVNRTEWNALRDACPQNEDGLFVLGTVKLRRQKVR